MSNELVINIKNLNIELVQDKKKLIVDFSLPIYQGEILGIVGESGSGKSLTSQALLGLLNKANFKLTGEIIFNNENLLEFSNEQFCQIRGSQIAYIPQDPMTSLNPLYTIGYQMVDAIVNHQKINSGKAKELALNALRQVHLNDVETKFNKYPHELSGGMKQRIIIALALSLNPKVLIADEPTTALDVTIQAQILRLLQEIQTKKNLTIVLITHDLSVVASLCHKIAVMYSGQIMEYAKSNEFFARPQHPYSIGLINSIPNFNVKKLMPIAGKPIELSQLITGCRFNPRCNLAIAKCFNYEPSLRKLDNDTLARCFVLTDSQGS